MPSYSVSVSVGFENELDYKIFLKHCEDLKMSFRAVVKKLIYNQLQDIKKNDEILKQDTKHKE